MPSNNSKYSQEHRSRRREAEQALVDKVVKVFKEHREIYGSKKIYREINREMHVSEWKIRKIMRENGLYSICVRKYRPSRGKAGSDISIVKIY